MISIPIENINQLLIIAVLLDPRYKLEYVNFCFKNLCHAKVVEKLIANIKESLIKFYDYYCTLDSIYNGTISATLFSYISLPSDVAVEKVDLLTSRRLNLRSHKERMLLMSLKMR